MPDSGTLVGRPPYAPRLRRDGLVELVSGDIACKVELQGIDVARALATYDVQLGNTSAVSVSCRLYGIDEAKRTMEIGMLDVVAGSLGRSRFVVPLGGRNVCECLYVEIAGEGISLLSETRLPRAKRSVPFGRIGCIVAAIGAGLLVYLSVPATNPTVRVGVPSEARPGPVSATYALHDTTSASYRVVGSNGANVAAGTLATSNGVITFAVPESLAGRSVRVSVDARNATGEHVGSGTIGIVASRAVVAPVDVARIVALSAHRETYAGNVSVLASYAAVADGGALRILDARNAILGEAPFTRVGTSRIVLPQGVRYDGLRAELAVTRGASRAVSSVELPPEAAPAPSASSSVSDALSDAAAPALGADGNAAAVGDSVSAPGDPFIATARVVGGMPFDVAIRRHLPRMRIELQDEFGVTLDKRSVAADAPRVRFAAPAVSIATTYFLSCSFMRGAAQETLVRSLRIFPH